MGIQKEELDSVLKKIGWPLASLFVVALTFFNVLAWVPLWFWVLLIVATIIWSGREIFKS